MSARSKLRPADVFALAFDGVRAKPMRVVLSGLGIAIGIAAMIAVVGISASGQARLNQEFSRLGTNLLSASASKSFSENDRLPSTAVDSVNRLPEVDTVSSYSVMKKVNTYRNNFVDRAKSGGLQAAAADQALLTTTKTDVAQGTWFNGANSAHPTVVLGSKAAQRLGVSEVGTTVQVGNVPHTVIGMLEPSTLAPELDTSVLMSQANAKKTFGADISPTTLYERSDDEQVDRVRSLLATAINPESPQSVEVSRPSDALQAKAAADSTFTGLMVGLGGVALLVGGIGVANTMIISVLERRGEIGLRRALGATRKHIRIQFLGEALLLSAFGGLAGCIIGSVVTVVIAVANGWLVTIPPIALGAGLGATVIIGMAAGLYPAIKASKLPPTVALAGA